MLSRKIISKHYVEYKMNFVKEYTYTFLDTKRRVTLKQKFLKKYILVKILAITLRQ